MQKLLNQKNRRSSFFKKCNNIGHLSEYKVRNILKQYDCIVIMPSNPNQKLYNMLIYNRTENYLAQIKTDANGDNIYPSVSLHDKNDLIKVGKILYMTPIIINFNYKKNIIHSIYEL